MKLKCNKIFLNKYKKMINIKKKRINGLKINDYYNKWKLKI